MAPSRSMISHTADLLQGTFEYELIILPVDRHHILLSESAIQHQLGDRVFDVLLDGPLQRTCTKDWVEAGSSQLSHCRIRDFQTHVALCQAICQALQLNACNRLDVLGVQSV